MQFDAALIKEQGVGFAVVVVKSHILNDSSREDVRQDFSRHFPGVPIILMAQDSRGTPTYHGRPDIVKYLASIHPGRIPFKRYTIN